MAKGSMPWDHEGGGDGNPTAELFVSKYSGPVWAGFWGAVLGSSQGNVLVIPGIGGMFAVSQRGAGANMSVDIASGEALVNGTRVKYDTTENLILEAADATNPRIDRIILRWTGGTTQTVRPAVLKGTASATPSLPALTQTAATYEVDLGHVWVAASAVSIASERISDRRVFAPNLFTAPFLVGDNLIEASEFLGYFPARIYPPARWSLFGSPSAIQTNTRPPQMARGYAVQITADAADEGITQTFSVTPSSPYAIKGLVNVTAGDVGKIVVTSDAAAPGTITREIHRTGEWMEETIYYTTEADATTLTIRLLAANNGDIVQFGQFLALPGYFPGPFRMIQPEEAETLIDEIELTADQANIDFQNIPQVFSHLRAKIRVRTDRAAALDSIMVRINNDSTANYDNLEARIWNPTTKVTAELIGDVAALLSDIVGNTSPANTFSPVITDFLNYRDTTKKHEVVSRATVVMAESASNLSTFSSLSHYRVTGSAISRLTFIVAFGTNFKAGTRISLYGVK